MTYARKRWLKWILIFSVVLNLGTLGTFWLNHFNERRLKGGPQLKEVITEELGLDEKQKDAYYGFVKLHQDKSALIRKEIARAKREYYSFDQNEEKNNLALQNLKNAYGKLDTLNYSHFKQIRSICKGKQLDAFDQLFEKIMDSSNFGFTGPRE